METAKVHKEILPLGQTLSPSAVQGVPWWGGIAQQMLPLDLMYSHFSHQGARVVDSGFPHVVYSGVASDESQTQAGGTPVGLPPVTSGFILPNSQLDMEHGTVLADANPFHNGVAAPHGLQGIFINPEQIRMALPVEVREEEPVYVNAKQYRGIMRRRQSRAKAESENKLVKSRKPYLHESRHLHAMRRARGCGGRFLNTKNKDQARASPESARSSEGQSSDAHEDKDPGQSYGTVINGPLPTGTTMT